MLAVTAQQQDQVEVVEVVEQAPLEEQPTVQAEHQEMVVLDYLIQLAEQVRTMQGVVAEVVEAQLAALAARAVAELVQLDQPHQIQEPQPTPAVVAVVDGTMVVAVVAQDHQE
jgi:uncharacterized heparinase superfamily protein